MRLFRLIHLGSLFMTYCGGEARNCALYTAQNLFAFKKVLYIFMMKVGQLFDMKSGYVYSPFLFRITCWTLFKIAVIEQMNLKWNHANSLIKNKIIHNKNKTEVKLSLFFVFLNTLQQKNHIYNTKWNKPILDMR